MSTVTSFSPPAETCIVHVLHGEGRSESKRNGGGFTWRRLSRLVVANNGAVVPAVLAVLVATPTLFFSSSFLPVFLFFLPLRVFFFSFFRSYPLLFFLSSLPSLFCLLSFLSFFFSPPLFLQGHGGAATMLSPLHRPSNTWKVWVVSVSF